VSDVPERTYYEAQPMSQRRLPHEDVVDNVNWGLPTLGTCQGEVEVPSDRVAAHGQELHPRATPALAVAAQPTECSCDVVMVATAKCEEVNCVAGNVRGRV
jgi:hypothetical protein